MFLKKQMEVSWNRGTRKSSILIGCSLINHPICGTPISGNLQMVSSVATLNFCKWMTHVSSRDSGGDYNIWHAEQLARVLRGCLLPGFIPRIAAELLIWALPSLLYQQTIHNPVPHDAPTRQQNIRSVESQLPCIVQCTSRPEEFWSPRDGLRSPSVSQNLGIWEWKKKEVFLWTSIIPMYIDDVPIKQPWIGFFADFPFPAAFVCFKIKSTGFPSSQIGLEKMDTVENRWNNCNWYAKVIQSLKPAVKKYFPADWLGKSGPRNSFHVVGDLREIPPRHLGDHPSGDGTHDMFETTNQL